jgi:3-oxoacyl-[acyl-carrier protein] reductase
MCSIKDSLALRLPTKQQLFIILQFSIQTLFFQSKMSQKTVIITGASQGIGRATSIKLASDFSSLILVARKEDELQQTAKIISDSNKSVEILIIAIDLLQKDASDHVVSRTLEEFGRIDAIVNIAGAVPQLDLFTMTESQWDDGFGLKLHAARRLTVRAWDSLKKTNGSVIFMSGNSALTPKIGFAAVATVNAAIVAFSKAMADQGIQDGIQVNTVLPGAVLTDRRYSYLKRWAEIHQTTEEEALKQFPSKAGISRFGKPEEIAGLISFMLSNEGQWLRGSAITMDGGEIKSI